MRYGVDNMDKRMDISTTRRGLLIIAAKNTKRAFFYSLFIIYFAASPPYCRAMLLARVGGADTLDEC